jgi:2-(1,2-epoxy-1,2-dihydrophenyl)acetyl-CoA isomerase
LTSLLKKKPWKMSRTENLLTGQTDGVLTITLNRPKVNALDREMIAALQAAFNEAGSNHQIRCVLLTGRGNVFSAGQDITDFDASGTAPFRRHLLSSFNPLILQVRRLEKPVLSAINGVVSGAALGLVLACDLRIASDQARFITGFAGIGLVPDSAVSLFLPALVGLGRATELVFTNAFLNAAKALDWGLVNRVVPDAQLFTQAFGWAAELAHGPVRALGLAKREFNRAILADLEQVLDYEAHIQEIAGHGAEPIEGLRAFQEKRAPNFLKLESKD